MTNVPFRLVPPNLILLRNIAFCIVDTLQALGVGQIQMRSESHDSSRNGINFVRTIVGGAVTNVNVKASPNCRSGSLLWSYIYGILMTALVSGDEVMVGGSLMLRQ